MTASLRARLDDIVVGVPQCMLFIGIVSLSSTSLLSRVLHGSALAHRYPTTEAASSAAAAGMPIVSAVPMSEPSTHGSHRSAASSLVATGPHEWRRTFSGSVRLRR